MKKPYIITNNNIHIVDSCLYPKGLFDVVINGLRTDYPDNAVLLNRSNKSISREWATHNLLWSLGIYRSHTKDVDLNYPQKWYEKLEYFVIGSFALLVIK